MRGRVLAGKVPRLETTHAGLGQVQVPRTARRRGGLRRTFIAGTLSDSDQDIGLNGVAALPGNNPIWNPGPHPAANYVEKGVFVRAGDNSTKITPKGPGKQYDQINAGNIQ